MLNSPMATWFLPPFVSSVMYYAPEGWENVFGAVALLLIIVAIINIIRFTDLALHKVLSLPFHLVYRLTAAFVVWIYEPFSRTAHRGKDGYEYTVRQRAKEKGLHAR